MAQPFNAYTEWLQIPPDRTPTHYDLLGLPQFENDQELIRTRYWERFERVRRYEVGSYTQQALALLEEISDAFRCLSDPESKQGYDRALRDKTGEHSTTEATLPEWSEHPLPPSLPSVGHSGSLLSRWVRAMRPLRSSHQKSHPASFSESRHSPETTAFLQDLEELVRDHEGEWVAYRGEERLSIHPSKAELWKDCLAKGKGGHDFTVFRIQRGVYESESPAVVPDV